MAIQTSTGTVKASGDKVTLGNNGDSACTVYVYGTHAGITLVFEGTVDGTNWVGIPAFLASSGVVVPSAGIALPANSTKAFYLVANPWSTIRVRATAYTSGTLNVNMQVGTGKALGIPTAGLASQEVTNVGNATVQLQAGNNGAVPLVTSGPGILHSLVVTTAGTVSLVLFDNASAASGTKLFASAATYSLATQTVLNLTFQNGITANQVTGTAAVSLNYQLL